MRIKNPRVVFAACGAVAALAVAGCGDDTAGTNGEQDVFNDTGDTLGEMGDTATEGVEGFFGQGGDTTCGEFAEQDPEEQRTTVADYLQQEGQQDPSEAEIDSALLSIDAMCTLEGEEDTPISEAGVTGGDAGMPEEDGTGGTGY